MIIRVSKDLENGSWGEDGVFTGEVTYAVITDSSDGLSLFYDKDALSLAGLPLRKQEYAPGLYVDSITFDRREDRNFKDNGHLNGAGSGKYAIWDYVVTISSSAPQISDIAMGGSSFSSYPDSLSITPKFYEVYDERHYKSTDIIGKPTAIVRDLSGHVMPSTRQLVNPVIQFSYYMRDFHMRYLDLALFTVNKEAITVCGIDIPPYTGKIINLFANKENDSDRFLVSCELEIGVQKNVWREELLSKGFYANLKGVGGDFKGIRVQRASTIPKGKDNDKLSDEVKEKKAPGHYGKCFGNWGDKYNDLNSEDPVIHDPEGYPYLGEETDLAEAIKSGKVGIVNKYLSVGANWKPLDFPKKGFKD